jgi:hypothetical protein
MAIKGKGKTRSRRTISAPPRPTLVVRKPPIWRRRWVWAVAGGVAIVGILVGLTIALRSSSKDSTKKKRSTAVLAFVTNSRAALPADRQAVPPDLVVIFPSVGSDVANIGKTLTGQALIDRGKQITQQAAAATKAMNEIPVTKIVPAAFPQDRQTLQDSQFLMAQALKLYEQVGGLFQAAASTSGTAQTQIVGQAQALMNEAGTLFDQGYRKLVRLAEALGVPIKTAFNPPPSAPVPGPTVTPSASASGSPSPGASASPTASPSGSSSPTASPSG